jgi:hypothetical protein
MEIFPKDSITELSTKNLDNYPSFLTITHMTMSTKWFRSYGILMIHVAAEFCIQTKQCITDPQFPVSDWPKHRKSQILFWKKTLSAFRWSIIRLQMVSGLRVTVVENSTSC